MKSDRWRRRALYSLSSGMWVVSICLAVHSGISESLLSRTALLLVLGMTGCLTTASLFMMFVAPLERVYRHGYEAGQRASMRWEPDELRAVPDCGAAAGRPVVVPIKVVRRDIFSRS